MSLYPQPSEASFRELVNLMRVQRGNNAGFCLFLGAGCSLSSSHKDISTIGILTRYLEDRHPNIAWAEQTPDQRYKTFVNSWLALGRKDRNDVLARYLSGDMEPSSGYVDVARLAGDGYVKAIVTTNFDNLLDKALTRYGVAYELHCGAQAPISPGGKAPVITLVKVHGGLHQSDLVFSPDDLDELPRSLARLVRRLSELPMLVVGYSGQDRGVMKALSPSDDRTVFWASPTAPSRDDRATTDRVFNWLDKRVPKGNPFLTGDDLGRFDQLFARLYQELTQGGAPPVGRSHFR